MSQAQLAFFKQAVEFNNIETFQYNSDAPIEAWKYAMDYALTINNNFMVMWLHNYKHIGPSWRGTWETAQRQDKQMLLFLYDNYPETFTSMTKKFIPEI